MRAIVSVRLVAAFPRHYWDPNFDSDVDSPAERSMGRIEDLENCRSFNR